MLQQNQITFKTNRRNVTQQNPQKKPRLRPFNHRMRLNFLFLLSVSLLEPRQRDVSLMKLLFPLNIQYQSSALACLFVSRLFPATAVPPGLHRIPKRFSAACAADVWPASRPYRFHRRHSFRPCSFFFIFSRNSSQSLSQPSWSIPPSFQCLSR